MTENTAQTGRRKAVALGVGAALLASTVLGGAAGAYVAVEARDRPVAAAPAALQRTAFAGSQISLADMVEAVGPAVVQIRARETAPRVARSAVDGSFGSMLERFSDRRTPRQRPGNEAMGSGFIVDEKGVVVTNAHVIGNADQVSVKLADGREFEAAVVGKDEKTDLAVLRVKGGGGFTAVDWGDSGGVRVGEDVFAVGSPFGLGNTVTKGIVSGRGRAIGAGPYDDFLQVDAPINSGNSGGPLFDASGKVVGVNTAIYSPSGGNVGIGFAIPADMAREVVAQLADKGSVVRGQIGVMIQEVTPEVADSLGLANTKGALVAGVTPGGPAERAGLRAGDVVRSFGGTSLDDARDLSRAVAAARIGESVPVTVLRDGRTRTLPVSVAGPDGERAPRLAARADRGAHAGAPQLGLRVAPASARLNAEAGQPQAARGVMVMDVDSSGRAAARGLAAGDIIVAVNTARVETPEALAAGVSQAARAGRKHVLIEMLRGGERSLVTVPLA